MAIDSMKISSFTTPPRASFPRPSYAGPGSTHFYGSFQSKTAMYLGVSINGGIPNFQFIMENPTKMDNFGGGTPILGHLHSGIAHVWTQP